MIRLAVCDDDPIFLSQAGELARCFLDTQKIPASVSCYPDAESLLEARAHCDIYLLDILMPGLDGIALAKELERRDQDFCVIYLTTSEEYALEAFSVDALQYLVKPVTEPALFGALQKALALLNGRKTDLPPLLVSTPDGETAIALSSLCYVEHLDKVLYFHRTDGTVLRSSTGSMKISDLTGKLSGRQNFLSPHRGYLVNMDYIRTFSASGIRMENGEVIPVARAGGSAVRRQYMDYLLGQKGGGLC